MTAARRTPSDIAIVHSSDLHVDDGYTARAWGGDGTAPLAAVLETAAAVAADLVLLTGDVFEHNRLPPDVLSRTADVLGRAPCPVVMLPGNHDPLMPDSVWDRGGFGAIDGVRVLSDNDDTVEFGELGLEVWGRAHTDYVDMAPLADPPLAGSATRSVTWHIAAGHGHYVDTKPGEGELGPSWLISHDEIEATRADYVALGHWNTAVRVGNGRVPAWYSGSPDLARTVNLVRLTTAGTVEISHEPVRGDLPKS